MAGVKIENVSKRYPNGFLAVQQFNLDISDKEFIVFVGPSGCGKSTTLRMIAGLEDITSGSIYIDEKKANDVAPKDRDIAMVFQNYALYPHMTVYENMAFGLKLQKVDAIKIDKRVKEVASILDIGHLLKRKPMTLSGGQKQRVAMGRAIVREPKVFLMDEPLSNLDTKLRAQMRTEIARLHQRLQATFIYVTHDQTEAMTLGSRIVVMKDGIIQQVDTPLNIYHHPQNTFVAEFIGSPQMNFFEAKVIKKSSQVFLSLGGVNISLPTQKASSLIHQGYENKTILVGVRPENLSINHTSSNQSFIQTTVDVVEMVGADSYLYFQYQNQTQSVRIADDNTFQVGDRIQLFINSNKIHLFDLDTDMAISEMHQ